MLDTEAIKKLLDVFPMRTLTKLSFFLTQFVAIGITDIRAVQEYLQRYIDKKHKDNQNDLRRRINRKERILGKRTKPSTPNAQREIDKIPTFDCPDCGKHTYVPLIGAEERIMICTGCRYSKIVESIHELG